MATADPRAAAVRRLPAGAVLAACALLPGCVAAAVPLAVGGLIARSQITPSSAPEQAAAPAAHDARLPAGAQAASEEPQVPAELSSDPALIARFEAPPAVSGEATQGWRALARHALDAAAVSPAPAAGDPAAPRLSALLAEPSALDGARARCGSAAPAILIDLDPQGGLAPLDGASVRPAPGLAPALAELRAGGVAIAWITDRTAGDAGALRRALAAAGLDPQGADPLLVMRYPGEPKQRRREALGAAYCLLAIAGDERADFADVFRYLRDPALAFPLEPLIGTAWFLTPTPLTSAN